MQNSDDSAKKQLNNILTTGSADGNNGTPGNMNMERDDDGNNKRTVVIQSSEANRSTINPF